MLAIVPAPGEVPDFSIVRSFRNLASCGKVCEGSGPGHGDGWGIVAWRNKEPVYLGREPVDAFSDPIYEEACLRGESESFSSPIIAHLRKASVGLKVKENTHPFTNGEWAFAHNGTIRKLNLKFTTDSQWFFELVLNEYSKNGQNMIAAISKQVEMVRQIYRYSSLTFLMSNGRKVYGYRDCASNEDYYTLFYAKTPKCFLISQEKFVDAPWVPLQNGALISIDEDLTCEINYILPRLESKNV
jgi:predicted glutamine amidotransferase